MPAHGATQHGTSSNMGLALNSTEWHSDCSLWRKLLSSFGAVRETETINFETAVVFVAAGVPGGVGGHGRGRGGTVPRPGRRG